MACCGGDIQKVAPWD